MIPNETVASRDTSFVFESIFVFCEISLESEKMSKMVDGIAKCMEYGWTTGMDIHRR